MNSIKDIVLEGSIETIQEHVLKGDFTIEELVTFYLNRIEAYKAHHAIIELNSHALSEARRQDQILCMGGTLGDLFGTVILLKDNIVTKDMPFTAGAMALIGSQSDRDAHIVELLKAEDAIIIGKANLSEWANYMTEPSINGFSAVGGETKNAYGNFDAGGSSSGSAVGVSLNLVTASIGSETCGSLVYPASVNSIVTLKPTVGLISRDLVVPISEAQDTLGPMGRTVEDVWRVFKACIGYDINDPRTTAALEFPVEDFECPLEVDYLKGKRVGILKEDTSRYTKVCLELEEMGCSIVPFELNQNELGIQMLPVLDYGIVNDVKAFLNHEAISAPVKSLEEVVAFNQVEPDLRMPYGQKLFEQALKNNYTFEAYEAIEVANHLIGCQTIDQLMKTHQLDVIVSFVTDLAVVYSVARYPAVLVPAGYGDSGEPYGITFVGRYNQDIELLRCAYAYEQKNRHRKMPKESEEDL